MSEYRVQLDVFAGPLDLLLYLVRREEVDIYDIPIASITAEYLKYIEILNQLDIELAGDFLVMAATLMEIKSAMLLPRAGVSDDESGPLDDPRAELVRQLLEYKRFKDAANLLSDAASERQQRYTRPDTIIDGLKSNRDEPEVDIDQVSIWTLLEAFDGIMKATGRISGFEHIKDDTPIDLYQIEMLHRLQSEGPLRLEQLFENRGNRLIMIGLFLAMLELIRNQLIYAEQPDAPGPIFLKSLTEEPAEMAVQRAIFAAEQASQAKSDQRESPENYTEPQDILFSEQQPQEQEIASPIEEDESVSLPRQEMDDKPVPSQKALKPPIPIKEIKAAQTSVFGPQLHQPENNQRL